MIHECLTHSDLDLYHTKELDQDEDVRVREHLNECAACTHRDAARIARHEMLIKQVRGLEVKDTRVDPAATVPDRDSKSSCGFPASDLAEGSPAPVQGRPTQGGLKKERPECCSANPARTHC